MNAIQAEMSKQMSEDDIFGNVWNQRLKSTFRLKMKLITWCFNTLWCHTATVNKHYKHINLMNFQIQWAHYQLLPLTPTPSCTNNTAINLPGSPEFANNRINFPQLQTQDSQSQYAVGNALLEYMQSNHLEWNETRIFLRLYFICTSFFHTNRQTVTVKLCLYFFCVSITLHSLSLIWSVLV